MKKITIDDFGNLRCLSKPTFSPAGSSACFVVTEAEIKKNRYRSRIFMQRGDELRALTSFGAEQSFCYETEDTLLFSGDREPAKEPTLRSRFYRISLTGGEAELAYEFPIPVKEVYPLPGGDLLVLGTVFPGYETLYTGDEKLAAAYQKAQKENEDYEVVTSVPWWWNGSTYTRGAYTSLFRYDAKRKKLHPLTEAPLAVTSVRLSADRSCAYFTAYQDGTMPDPNRPDLYRLSLADGSFRRVFESSKELWLSDFALGSSFVLLLLCDGSLGMNTDPDFYRLDPATLEVTKYADWKESIGCSVGSDARYGSGAALRMDGDTAYFISTRFESAYLYQLKDGTITRIIDREGSVDCFDVRDGRLLLVGLYDMRPQELYDGSLRCLSHFNDRAIRGRYVAKPEPLSLVRDGHELHGFVFRPFGFEQGKKYPVIFDIHGGPKGVYGPVFFHEMQFWCSEGYFVICCNPTGSDGRGSFSDIRGKYGTVDYDDLMAFCDAALSAYPEMDAGNLFETGGSYGGFMTNWIIGHTDRFRACATQRSICNWFSMWGISDIGVEFTDDQMACDPWSDPEKLWWHSPMKYADRIKTPTLVLHSFEDYRCPVDQGYQMYTALVAHGVDTRLVLFRGENHELSRSGKPLHRIRRLREITDWFAKYRAE